MTKTCRFVRIIAATLITLVIGAAQARAAVTAYADEVPSNDAVTASALALETNVSAAQTNLNMMGRSQNGNSQVQIDETGVHIGGPNPVDIQVPSYLRHRGGANIVGIVSVLSPFVMVVAIVALSGYFAYRRNRMAHETVRAMIDKGMPVTPELVAQLRSKRWRDGNGWSGSNRLLPGLVMAGIGTALLLSGSGGDRKGGWIVLFIGLAFLVVWAVERKNPNNKQLPK
jgi:hypothetical protein